jgi:hypothetical protein
MSDTEQAADIEIGAVVHVVAGELWNARHRFFLSAHDGWREILDFTQDRGQFVGQVAAEATSDLPAGSASIIKRGVSVGERLASFLEMEAMPPGSVVVYEALGKSYTKQEDGLWLGDGNDRACAAAYSTGMIASGTTWLSAPEPEPEAGMRP